MLGQLAPSGWMPQGAKTGPAFRQISNKPREKNVAEISCFKAELALNQRSPPEGAGRTGRSGTRRALDLKKWSSALGQMDLGTQPEHCSGPAAL